MLTYRHGEQPDLKGVGWHLFWLCWCAAAAGYSLALHSWPTLVCQLICLAVWAFWTWHKLKTMTWLIVTITTPIGDKEGR